jgi:hypothetical protein
MNDTLLQSVLGKIFGSFKSNGTKPVAVAFKPYFCAALSSFY